MIRNFPAIALLTASSLALALTSCGSQKPDAAAANQPAPAASTPAPSDAKTAPATPAAMNVYSLKLQSLDGKPVDMSQYQGKVTLIVNVASQCGYTPQYKGLQALHTELKDKGFAVLGFPCNDFGAQEPGSADEIRTFCSTKYAVDFPMFAKIGTKKGNEQSPLYAMLEQATGKLPGWNFCKYLVGKDGKPIAFYASGASPDGKELRDAIAAALQ
jgi:glutathione peroxidase